MYRKEFIASVQHIAWVSYQIAAGQSYNEKINDDQLESLMDGIDYLEGYRHQYGEYPSLAESHENWMRMKVAQGWVYGEAKDFDKKTHPDLVPFIDLPEIEKRKDTINNVSYRLAIELWDLMY